MAHKKIMLFIVEGSTDETALSTVLSRIFSSDKVMFRVVHGDIMTRDFITSNQIVNAVCQQIKSFCGFVYKQKDFCKIVHLTDMDGVFIPDSAVVEESSNGRHYPFYEDARILDIDPNKIRKRNQQKRDNIIRLYPTKFIWKIPYSLYYFSCNLDHVLHGHSNLDEGEKINLALNFELNYADRPDDFIRFMKEESFSVRGSYRETWNFIQQEFHSLERHSNFGLFLPESIE